jgi:endoglucanase
MNLRILAISAITFLLFACIPIRPAPTPDLTSQPATVSSDIFSINQRLGRGVNLGNALEAPREDEWGMTLQAEYFTLIARAGFDSVRIPIKWSAHAQNAAPYTIDAQFFERVDWAVEQAKANNLAAIINIHHYDELVSDPEGQTERFLALWEQIATHYQNEPGTVLFELLNEPNSGLTVARWNKILAQGVAMVRRSNPTRAIIIGPGQWNNIGYIGTLELPDDPYLIVTFHYYDPFPFTHQGAEWVDGASAWLGTTWDGGKFEQSAITDAFDGAVQWAKAHNRPLFLGEFGAYSKADLASRQRWTRFVAQTAVERGISFAYWEFGAGFGVYDRARGQWNEGLRAALLE